MTSKIVVNNIEADSGISSVTFTSNIVRGGSNLHSTGLALGAGSTVGAVTGVTTYYGDGSNLTGLVSLANGADNRVITASSATALNGEAGLTYNGQKIQVDTVTSETNAFRLYNTTTSATTYQINGEGDSFTGNVYPRSDGNLDLGFHSGYKWRDLVLNGGIRFGSANEVDYLDDYNEGTFQPYYDSTNSNLTFHGGTAANNSYYTSRSGSYVKIGKRVFFQISLSTNGLTVIGGSGQMRISGLPFTSAPSGFGVGSSTYPRAVVSCMGGRFNSFTPNYLVVNASSTNLQVRQAFETYGQAVGGTGGFDTSGSSNRNVIEAYGYYDVSN